MKSTTKLPKRPQGRPSMGDKAVKKQACTTMYLTPHLKEWVTESAAARGMSQNEFLTAVLEAIVTGAPVPGTSKYPKHT